MQRYYYLCDDLDELEAIEKELEEDGFPHRSIHVLSKNDASVSRHHLHQIPSVLRFDTAWYAGGGLLAGLVIGLSILLLAQLSGITEQIGAGPVALAALTITLFCGWEGGFLGFQKFNHRLRRFLPALHRGRHLLLIDIPDERIRSLQQHILAHPRLYPAGHDQSFIQRFL